MRHILAVTALILLASFATSTIRGQSDRDELEAVRVTEITLERVWTNCEDCGDYKVVLRRDGSSPHRNATVVYTNLKTKEVRQGKLYAYFYNQLAKLISAQNYFGLKDGYGLGVEDTLRVKTSVVRDGRRKEVVNNSNPAPIELWGIEMAIDGVLARVEWEGAAK